MGLEHPLLPAEEDIHAGWQPGDEAVVAAQYPCRPGWGPSWPRASAITTQDFCTKNGLTPTKNDAICRLPALGYNVTLTTPEVA